MERPVNTTSGTHGSRRKNMRIVQRVVISAGPDWRVGGEGREARGGEGEMGGGDIGAHVLFSVHE